MRDLTNMNEAGSEKTGWQTLKSLNSEVVGKAVYANPEIEDERIMKSTKRFKVTGGWIYNTTTEYHKGNMVSVAEAICFVPEKR